jgi:VanZ family protein
MKFSRISGRLLGLIALLGLLAFTSTSLAGEASDNFFHFLMALIFAHLRSRRLLGIMHFTAEKSVHFVLFFVLATLLLKTMPESKCRTLRILSLALLTGIFSELLQFLFPGRDPSVRDVLIDFCGSVSGILWSAVFRRRVTVGANESLGSYSQLRNRTRELVRYPKPQFSEKLALRLDSEVASPSIENSHPSHGWGEATQPKTASREHRRIKTVNYKRTRT